MRETTEVRHYSTEFKICNANFKKIIYNDERRLPERIQVYSNEQIRKQEIRIKSRDKKRVENERENI